MNSLRSMAHRLSGLLPIRGRAARLALKELRETLRDRRTLITLLLMPLLVYPLLGVILQKALLSAIVPRTEEVSYSVAFASEQEAQRFQAIYTQGDQLLRSDKPQLTVNLTVPEEKTLENEFNGPSLIANGYANMVVLFRDLGVPGRERLELLYEEGNPHSQAILIDVEERLRAVNHEIARRALRRQSPRMGHLMEVAVTPVKPAPTGPPQFSLATFIPLMLILMTVTGAVYPAIDLTAGERERGTLEVLVAAPVPRMELLSAKFIAVLTVAMLTAIVNLTAMLITVHASGLEDLVFGTSGLSWVVMGQILALLFLFAGFFSAVLLALTSFARSFKEAQAYLIPLMLVSLAPGVFSLTPGLKMNPLLAMMPLVNIVLLGRDLLQGQVDPWLLAASVVSTILYGFLALSLAARVFGTDAILYGSQGSLKDLFRRPQARRDVPTPSQVMFALAVLFPAFVILGSLPGRFPSLSIETRLTMNSAVLLLLFVAWPAFLVWRNRVRFSSAFRTALPSPWAFLAAIVLGMSLWVWAYELEIALLTDERIEWFRQLAKSIHLDLDQVPLALRLFALAIIPAACEEWFFRGYLLSGCRARMPAFQAVLVSAGLFGLFHVMLRDALLFERFLPSAIMGVVLGWLAVKSGSVWPGMLLHVLHNGLILTISAYKDHLETWGIGLEEQKHLPPVWLIGSALVVGLGVVLLLKLPPNAAVAQATDTDRLPAASPSI
jgi:ABC-2 type transport system permease protein/sodium transport system permease protein